MEIFELLKLAKEHTPENWIGMMFMYLMLKRDIRKAFEKAKPGMLDELGKLIKVQVDVIKAAIDQQVSNLVKAIEGHNTRLSGVEADVKEIKKKLSGEDK